MPSRYLFQDLQDLKDLPDFIESHFKEVKKEITGLKNKLEEIEAIENYFARNLLFEQKQLHNKRKGKFNKKFKKFLTLQLLTVKGKFDYIQEF